MLLNYLTLTGTMPVHMYKDGIHGLISRDADYDQFVFLTVRLVFDKFRRHRLVPTWSFSILVFDLSLTHTYSMRGVIQFLYLALITQANPCGE
jgi:hypothetical protein